jgi:uncharacterized membrane protein
VAVLAIAWLFTFLVRPWSNEANMDVTHFPPRAQEWIDGKLPYRDRKFEYPPLAVPLIGLPQLVKVGSYKLGFGLIELGFALALLVLCGLAARMTGGDPRWALLAVAVSPFLLGALVRGYFDLAPIALTMGALVAILAGRTKLGFGLLGAAVMTKGFPLVVAPIAIAWLLGLGERRRALEGTAVMAAVIGVVGAVALALSPSGAWYAIHYQTARPLEVESTPATFLYAWDWIAGDHGHPVGSYGSINILHRGSGLLTVLFGLLLLTVLVLLTLRAARDPSPRALVLAAIAAVASFAAFGKVFSPQYAIWLVPLLAMSLAWRQWWSAALAAAAMAITRVEFPSHFDDLVGRKTGIVLLLLERNLFVVVLVGVSLWTLWTGGWGGKPLVPSWSGRETRVSP